MSIIQSRQEIRQELVTWLKQSKFKYHVTLTFSVPLDAKQAVRVASKLMRMVRRELFGKNSHRDYLKGFAILENQRNNNPHFHLLVVSHPRLERSRKNLRELIHKKARSFKGFYYVNGRNLKVRLFSANGLCVQEYYDGNLEMYLTKNLEWQYLNYDFITMLNYDGLLPFPQL